MALRDIFTGSASGASSFARKISGMMDDPLIWIIRMVFFAGILAVWMHSGAKPFGFEQLAFSLLLGLAALSFEYLGSTRITRAWFERTPLGVIGWALVWAGAFAYSANAWLGVASEGQATKGAVHKAANFKHVDNRAERDRLDRDLKAERANIERLRISASYQTVVDGVTLATVDAADAMIDKAKAHRFWTVTNSCAETRGPQTRDFCASYRSAVAARANLADAIVRKEELKVAEEKVAKLEPKYEKAKADAEDTPVVDTAERSDLRMLVRYAAMDSQTAADTQAILKVIVISLFLSLAGFLREAEHHRNKPRKPWGIGRFLRSLWSGKAEPNQFSIDAAPGSAIVLRETNTIEDPAAKRTLDDLASFLKSRFEQKAIA